MSWRTLKRCWKNTLISNDTATLSAATPCLPTLKYVGTSFVDLMLVHFQSLQSLWNLRFAQVPSIPQAVPSEPATWRILAAALRRKTGRPIRICCFIHENCRVNEPKLRLIQAKLKFNQLIYDGFGQELWCDQQRKFTQEVSGTTNEPWDFSQGVGRRIPPMVDVETGHFTHLGQSKLIHRWFKENRMVKDQPVPDVFLHQFPQRVGSYGHVFPRVLNMDPTRCCPSSSILLYSNFDNINL